MSNPSGGPARAALAINWLALARLFRRARGGEAALKLALAYHNVFDIRNEDVQIVLADLADYTGFYRVNGEGIPPDDRAFSDGKRAAFGRLFRFLNLTDEEKAALVQAARTEAIASSNEGII